jgi:uncharacterized protein
MSKPVPVPDQTSEFFWAGASRGQLLVQKCPRCHRFQYPPTVCCEYCQSRDLDVVEVSGRGSLYAMAVMHRAFLPDFAEDVPYTIALVDLDDAPGARMLTNIVEHSGQGLKSGDRLQVVFERRGDLSIPQFRPLRDGEL